MYPPIAVHMQFFGAGGPTLIGALVSGGGSAAAEALDVAIVLGSSMTGAITSVNTARASAASQPAIAPNDWIEIHGINLVPTNKPASGVTWSTAPEFAVGKMPTQLNGVSVTVNGKPAYVYFYCSAATNPVCPMDQINVLTPPDFDTGAGITVTSGAGRIQDLQVGERAATPSFLRFGGSRYVVASHADYSLAGPASLYPGLTTPVWPGETMLLWGVGFGLPAETITPGSAVQSGSMPGKLACTLGARPAAAAVALVSPGLYQLNLTVPPDARSGDQPVSCVYAGTASPDGGLIAVR
jgi:uncharacterized protein (TIGR03437 family)